MDWAPPSQRPGGVLIRRQKHIIDLRVVMQGGLQLYGVLSRRSYEKFEAFTLWLLNIAMENHHF
jgi:hypothetical protein